MKPNHGIVDVRKIKYSMSVLYSSTESIYFMLTVHETTGCDTKSNTLRKLEFLTNSATEITEIFAPFNADRCCQRF